MSLIVSARVQRCGTLEGVLSFDAIVIDMERMESRECDLMGDTTS